MTPRGTALAPMPGWLLALSVRPAEAPANLAPRPVASHPDSFARAQKYIAKVGPAIAGAGGHSHTFVLASRLVRGFGLGDDDAFALLSRWNVDCQPPWSEADLRRKVREARAHGAMRPGELLERRRVS